MRNKSHAEIESQGFLGECKGDSGIPERIANTTKTVGDVEASFCARIAQREMAQEIPAERHCATFLIDYHGLAVLAVRQLLDSIEAREAGGGVQNPVSGLAPQKSFLGRFEGIEIDLKKHGFLLRRA